MAAPETMPRELITNARPVDRNTARKGKFLNTFPANRYRKMLWFCRETELAMARNDVYDLWEVVFTRVARSYQYRGATLMELTWQVYLLPKQPKGEGGED